MAGFKDEFSIAEEAERARGRQLEQALRDQGYAVSAIWSEVGEMARIDGTLTVDGRDFACELKNRACRSDRYPSGLLEMDRFYVMRQRVNAGERVLYAMLYTDAALIWPVTKQVIRRVEQGELPIERMNCPKSSYGRNRDYIAKACVMLPNDEAQLVPLPPR